MMFRWLCALVGLVAGLGVTGCGKLEYSTSSTRLITARGVRYSVPWETAQFQTTSNAFSYAGESVRVTEQTGKLTINGHAYGEVKSGDTVSVLHQRKVLVNRAERQPLPTAQLALAQTAGVQQSRDLRRRDLEREGSSAPPARGTSTASGRIGNQAKRSSASQASR